MLIQEGSFKSQPQLFKQIWTYFMNFKLHPCLEKGCEQIVWAGVKSREGVCVMNHCDVVQKLGE